MILRTSKLRDQSGPRAHARSDFKFGFRVKRRGVVFLGLAITICWLANSGRSQTEHHPMDRYNVIWDSPSKNSSGSMPLGNGDIGSNF